MSYKMTRAEAEQAGFTIDDCCNPPIAYKGPRFNPTQWLNVPSEEVEALTKQRDDLLAVVKKAREALEWAADLTDVAQRSDVIAEALSAIDEAMKGK